MRTIRRFNVFEDEFIKSNLGFLNCGAIAKRLGRNPASIVSRGISLGLRKPNRTVRRFSEREDKFIMDNAGKVRPFQIAKQLSRRVTSIAGRATFLGVDLKCIRQRKRHKDEYRNIAERVANRHLQIGEEVHHIDLDRYNNAEENLHIYSDKSTHNNAHRSLNGIIRRLLKQQVIAFDRNSGEYKLCETFN